MRRSYGVATKSDVVGPSQNRNAKGAGGHKEVDMVPIMNLFVTIIPILLQMVVMISIAYVTLDPSSAASGEGSAAPEKQVEKEAIESLILSINYDEEKGYEFYRFTKNDEADEEVGEIKVTELSKLTAALKGYREVMKKSDDKKDSDSEKEIEAYSIEVTPKDNIKFGTFVRTLDLCKKLKFTDIFLSDVATN
jgi:hypothetical protein